MSKIKIIRVVTSMNVIPWHMHNTLKRISNDFEVCVVGQNVSMYKNIYPDINFVDIDINRKINIVSDIKALYFLMKLIHEYKPDIIHSIMPKAGLVSALAGFFCRVPVRLHTFTGQIWATNMKKTSYFLYFIDRLINSLNTVCLADSFSQSNFLFKHKISYNGKPLPVLGKGSLSGVDIEKINNYLSFNDKKILKKKFSLDSHSFVFSYIARKTKEKGAIDMLKAFYDLNLRYKNLHLLFVGPDEDGIIEKLHDTNPELFHNVIEEGIVENVEDFILMSDVLCLPSYREGFGSIIIDAASIGVPAIGSNIDGLSDSISDKETGILFEAGSLVKLEEAMEDIMKNHELRTQMGKNAKRRVEAYFSADYIYQEQKKFYDKLVL